MSLDYAVIPVAGWGTRMLPFTRSVPKELLPVYDKTVLDWTVLELIACGIENIILVSSERKKALQDHIVVADFLRDRLSDTMESKLYAKANIQTVYQTEQLGLGHAIFQASDILNGKDFVVLLPDEIMLPFSIENHQFRYDLSVMMSTYQRTGALQVAVLEIPQQTTNQYGIVKVSADGKSIVDMVEKPPVDQAPSNLAMVGRYICNSTVMNALANISPGSNNEIQLTDALREVCRDSAVHIHKLQGERTDVGNKSGWLAAQTKFSDYFQHHQCSSSHFLSTKINKPTE